MEALGRAYKTSHMNVYMAEKVAENKKADALLRRPPVEILSLSSLEVDSAANLYLACASGAIALTNLRERQPEVGIASIVHWLREMHVVGDVVRLNPKLELDVFCNRCALSHRQIPVVESRTIEEVPRNVRRYPKVGN